MKQHCAETGKEMTDQIDGLQKKAEELRAASGEGEDADVLTPISSERKRDTQKVMSEMAARVGQAPTFEDLKKELEGKAETLADTASTNVEFQPSLRTLVREIGSSRLETAVQDMTRGVHAILKANKNLQKGSIALMTTSDVGLLDGVDDAVNKALWPLVALRKILKSIKGNAALLRGRDAEWAGSQLDEPNDDPARAVFIPSEELPIEETAAEHMDKATAEVAANPPAEMLSSSMPMPLLFLPAPLREVRGRGESTDRRRAFLGHGESSTLVTRRQRRQRDLGGFFPFVVASK